MTKALRRFLLICLTVLTFAFVGTAVACGEKNPEKVTFTVEVVNTDGEAIEGAQVIYCTSDNCKQATTGANGKVTIEVAYDIYGVHVVAEGYDQSETKLTSKEATQTLKFVLADLSTYTVNVVNSAWSDELFDTVVTAIEGATVSFYDLAAYEENYSVEGLTALATALTDANGVVSLDLAANEYYVVAEAVGYEMLEGVALASTSDSATLYLNHASGTENNPHVFQGTDTYATLNGKAYFTFETYNPGKYYINVLEDGATITVDDATANSYCLSVEGEYDQETGELISAYGYLEFVVNTTAEEVTVYLAVVTGEGTDASPLVVAGNAYNNNAGQGVVPVTIAANGSLFVQFPGMGGTYTISSDNASVLYKENPRMPAVALPQNFTVSMMNQGMFLLVNSTDAEVTANITILEAKGTEANPADFVIGANTVAFTGQPYFYAYTNTTDAEVTLSLTDLVVVEGDANVNLYAIGMYGSELVYDGVEGSEYTQTTFTVAAGETLVLGVGANVWSAVTITFTATVA